MATVILAPPLFSSEHSALSSSIAVTLFPVVCQVPGLFEGDEYTTLMTQCKEGSQRDGLMLDSTEELYKWFTQQVRVWMRCSRWESEGLEERIPECVFDVQLSWHCCDE